MVFIGFALLLPFNFVLNSIPFFALSFGPAIGYDIGVSYTMPQLALQPLILTTGQLTSPRVRLVGAAITQAVAMALMPYAGIASTGANSVLMVACGCATAVMESSLFGFVSFLPPVYTQGVAMGEGAAGLVSSLLQLAVKAALPDDPATVAHVYFWSACVIMSTAAVAVWKVSTFAVVRYYLAARTVGGASGTTVADELADGAGRDDGVQFAGGKGDADVAPAAALDADHVAVLPSRPAVATTARYPNWHIRMWLYPALRVGRRTWRVAASMFLVFVGTFLVFPGVTVTIPFRGSPVASETMAADGGWWTVLLIFFFAAADLAGRLMAAHTRGGASSHNLLLAYAVARFAVTPLVVGAARGWAALDNDVAAAVAIATLGLTNGHLFSLCMMAAPLAVETADREYAGFIQVLFLHAGIASGSALALALEVRA